MNLPNAITTLRVGLAPVVAYLLFQPRASVRLVAFVTFLLAALSDLWDGHLARQRGEITDFGKLVDPIADKLLLAATLIPFFVLTHRDAWLGGIPLFGGIGIWVLAIFFGREALITGLRVAAARHGTVVPAAAAGKRKAVSQNVFVGAMILWLAFRTAARAHDWDGYVAAAWTWFHGWFTTVSLGIALVLTLYSMIRYLPSFRRLLAGGTT